MTDHTLVAPEWLSQEAMQTLSSGYLLPEETPRAMFERVASAASKINKDESLYEDIFDCLWNGWLGLASPVAANYGTTRGYPISCYSVDISDDTPSIFSHLKEVAMLSKNGGGVGVYFGNIRPAGSPISGGGASLGKTAWMEGYDWASRKVSQSGKLRKGSFAMYTLIDDPDYPEILRTKDHTKGDPRSWIDSNLGVVITDEFMEDMIENGGHKQWLFGETIRTRLMSGSPYMLFIDNVNKQNPDCYKERGLDVKFSNLCFTGDTLAVLESGEEVPLSTLAEDPLRLYTVACSFVEHDPFGQRDLRKNVDGGCRFATAFRTRSGEVVKIYLEDGGSFRCTPDHLLATEDGKWREAQASAGVTLYTQDGKGVKVVKVEKAGFEENLYCLHVPRYNNFFIKGSDTAKIAVHNCSEITLYTDENHSFVCVLSSLNLSRWFEWRDWRSPRTGRSVPEIAIHLLEAVVSEFIKKAEGKVGMGRAVRFAKKSRALGLGTMGLHSLYQSQGLPFKSEGARALNIETHRFIREQAEKASRELAERFGEPEWCVGSGRRHTHLLAIAPTKTNSVISGAYTEGISPMDYNYYVAKQDKGAFVRKNPHLEKTLRERNAPPEVWDEIDKAQGSVQGLDCLTDHEKEVFLTAREIDQFELIKQAADRQPYICQAQSLNLWPDPNAPAEYLLRLHIAAWAAKVKSLYYLKSKSALIANQDEIDGDCQEPAIVVTKEGCPYCSMLKEKLKEDGVDFIEVNKEYASGIGMWSKDWETVPQLYLNNRWVGGYTDYMALAKVGTPPAIPTNEVYSDCAACEA